MRQPRLWLALAGVAAFIGLNLLVLVRVLDLGPPQPPRKAETENDDTRPVVRVGVISRYAPRLTYDAYQPVMDYLNAAGTHRYELKLSTSYEDAAAQLERGDVSASFFGAWIYARVGPALGLVPVLAPRDGDGVATARAVLITATGSGIGSVADLRGRAVALASRNSYAANWFLSECLPGAGLLVADLDSVHHYSHHQTVVYRVRDGHHDAGVVKEDVAQRFDDGSIRIVARSDPYPGPPLVVRGDDDSPALAELIALLLALDPAEPAAARLLAGWDNEFNRGFARVDAATYAQARLLAGEVTP
ncbi:MAG: PhnD/SsuA/transferrin family substrate-binding protein [bacterium]|nr:PhnD/SsuA/transferrin family substrate-binding protein [bacterium]